MTKLSTNFTLEELTFSQTAERLGLDNSPGPDALFNLRLLAERLEMIQALLKETLIITSAFRSVAVNRAIGSKDTSHHVLGGAADFICPDFGTPLEVALAIKESNIAYGQLIHEYGRWVHFSILPVVAFANRTITIDRKGTRVGLLPVA